MMQLEDNSKLLDTQRGSDIVEKLNDKELSKLQENESERFIIFPYDISESSSIKKDNYIFESVKGEVFTKNIVGFLKQGKEEIRITTRFYKGKKDGSDFFLDYMLGKVLNYNIISHELDVKTHDSYHDLLRFLFPFYLNQAMKKGIYKQYVKRKYNDANIKGPIDIARHIKINTPFLGKVAYRTREFSFDNHLTQLIRHTIEKLESDYGFTSVGDEIFKENVRAIKGETNNYSKGERQDILRLNIQNPVRHGYYEEYYQLQKLCIQILKDEEVGFEDDDTKIHGIIIDISWLWEEYLAILLAGYKHPKVDESIYDRNIYKEGKSVKVRPDFYCNYKKMILDAKYKRYNTKKLKGEDLFQIISYLHYKKANKAGVIYPSKKYAKYDEEDGVELSSEVYEVKVEIEGFLEGFGGMIFKLPLIIPQYKDKYEIFVKEIEDSEKKFEESLNYLEKKYSDVEKKMIK